MKKIITTLALALTIVGAVEAQPKSQRGQCASKPSPDAKLLSTSIDGDYQVCRWLVKSNTDDKDNQFEVRYQVNLAQLVSTYNDNESELVNLRAFIKDLMDDEDKNITQINVCGYASPDGIVVLNERLAQARADDFRKYLNAQCKLSKYSGTTKGVAYMWSDTASAIQKSAIPYKSDVLKYVEGTMSQPATEAKLRAMPSAWSYLAKNILPPMRCVEMQVLYTGNKVVETRTPIKPPVEVVEAVVVENNYFVVVEDSPSDIITFENEAAAPIDFEDISKSKLKFKDNRRREKIKRDILDEYGRNRGRLKIK